MTAPHILINTVDLSDVSAIGTGASPQPVTQLPSVNPFIKRALFAGGLIIAPIPTLAATVTLRPVRESAMQIVSGDIQAAQEAGVYVRKKLFFIPKVAGFAALAMAGAYIYSKVKK